MLMMFYMTSKTLQNTFLQNEDDKDILKAKYVLATTRIRKRNMKKWTNIISAKNVIFPDSEVCMALTDEDLRYRYFKQLERNEAFLATLIKGSIKDGYNIIFICTPNEAKSLKFLRYLSEYVYMEFGYPVYEYKDYASGAIALIKYNKEKVLKKCEALLDDAKRRDYLFKVNSPQGREMIIKDYKKMKKKELKKILKSKNLYQPGMDKEDMIDTLEAFL